MANLLLLVVSNITYYYKVNYLTNYNMHGRGGVAYHKDGAISVPVLRELTQVASSSAQHEVCTA